MGPGHRPSVGKRPLTPPAEELKIPQLDTRDLPREEANVHLTFLLGSESCSVLQLCGVRGPSLGLGARVELAEQSQVVQQATAGNLEGLGECND